MFKSLKMFKGLKVIIQMRLHFETFKPLAFKPEFVRMIGVEPTWIAPPDPKSGASANFATSAKGAAKVRHFSKTENRFVLRKFVSIHGCNRNHTKV
jgi:hypothetical protein